ncbi:RuvB ATP-dependent DNA helicase pontin [Gurleya vavrai]
MKEVKDVYEGEVTEYNFYSITLKSLKGSKKIQIDKSLKDSFENENIKTGDIVYIECNSRIVKKLGRSETFVQDCEIEREKYIPIPKGEVKRRKEIWQVFSLQDILQSKNKNYNWNFMSENKLTENLSDIVNLYLKNGNCEIKKGVLIIYNANNFEEMYLNIIKEFIESGISPFIVLVDFKKEFNGCIYLKENQFNIEKFFEEIHYEEEVLQFLRNLMQTNGINYVKNILKFIEKDDKNLTIQRIKEICSLFATSNDLMI